MELGRQLLSSRRTAFAPRRPAVPWLRGAMLAAIAVSAAVTLTTVLLPSLHSAYRRPALHTALETAAALIGLLAAFLMVGRLRRRGLVNDLLLACGLAALALSNLLFNTLPALTTPWPLNLTMWGALAANVLGGLLFAVAALARRSPLPRPRLLLPAVPAAVLAGVLLAIFFGSFATRVPHLAAVPLALPGLRAYPVPSTVQLGMMVLYGVAAAGFRRNSEQLGDEFLGWLAIAAVLATASRLNYSLYPALDVESAYVGEGFRLAFYGVLLAGCVREIWSYWRALSEAAVLEERRRIACDLHDGLAQELAYITRNLSLLDDTAGSETVARLRAAVERAQLESRWAIRALAVPERQALESALTEAAAEIADRFHLELELGPIPEVQLSAARVEALVRIACEALTNAARHSGARQVRINVMRDGQRVRLQVSDGGCGFDPSVPATGFGILSMGERARSVGGQLRILSAPGSGCQVEVAL